MRSDKTITARIVSLSQAARRSYDRRQFSQSFDVVRGPSHPFTEQPAEDFCR
jgi:hypothetical protein